ncbi:MAG: hypothetical protein WAQ77_02360 [Candidatus Acidiferrum sp.]
MRFWIRTLEPVFLVALALAVFVAWRADRRDRAQLASELAATKQLLAAADARQHDRDARLTETLTTLAAQKRAVKTPAQIVRELPHEIGLPAPIVLQSAAANASVPNQTDKPASANAKPADNAKQPESRAVIPAEDLKPLYDFTIDCKACQAKLTAAQADLTDEKIKTAALAKERDHALQTARGGSPFRRIARAAKWFVIGAAAGAIAAKSAH